MIIYSHIMKINSYYLIAFFSVVFLFISCGKNDNFKVLSYEKIDSVTQPNIKRLDDIRIVFAENVKYKDKMKQAISFSPKLTGLHQFVDEKTYLFHPSAPYDGISEIKMKVDLSLLFDGVAGERGFIKDFIVAPPSIFVDLKPLKIAKTKDEVEIEGTIETDIPYKIEELKKLFSVKREDGKALSSLDLEIEQGFQDTLYTLSVKGLKKEDADFNIILEYDASSIGATEKDSKRYTILAKNVFEIITHSVEDGSTINVYFSDLVKNEPNLITHFIVESETSFTYSVKVRDNVISLYNRVGHWSDGTKVTISKGIFSKTLESATKKDYSFVIKDSWDIPSVRFENNSNIIPSKENATLLIKTHNIKGIYMQAINIYGHNMLQMMQYENLGENHNLTPIGEPVWEGSFEFEWRDDMKNRDVVRAIDMSELVKKFPTGVFHIRIAFEKKDSMYQPKNASEDFSHLLFPKAKFYTYYWLSRNEYIKDYGDEVNMGDFWRQRNNPSHPAFYIPYYNYNLAIQKDVLVSNVALMAKKDAEGAIYVRVCDISTGRAIADADVEAFTYAQRRLKNGKTNKDGFIIFDDAKEVAFLKARKNGNDAYLKLTDGSEIEMGHFEVAGQERQEGIKGYIYGERGVWRPGDEIHLCFILQDEKKSLPDDIPVKFSLQDPLYTEVEKKVLTSNIGGIYRIDTKTASDAKTGTYTAKIKIGGNTWIKSLKIENIIPNRLFVELDPKENLKTGLNSIKLKSEWLHGAKASNLKAEVDCNYVINRAPFEKWKRYSFLSETNRTNFSTTSANLWKGVLNDEGEANLNVEMKVENAPGKLKAVFESRVYEDSGLFSVENKSLDFSPYRAYVGIMLPEGEDSYREKMLYTGKENTADIILVDSEGNLINGKKSCRADLYKLEWRWWWESGAYNSNALYSSSSSIKNVLSGNVTLQDGKGKWGFQVDDDEWGRYLLVVKDEEGGHSSSSVLYLDSPYWARRASGEVGIAETILQMQAGKEKYNVGEDITVSFPSAKDSFAYITLEKAGCVLDSRVIEGKGDTCTYTFKATAEMAPNIYVHASLVQPYKSVQNSLPIRLYGVIPIAVENANTHLMPEIVVGKDFESSKKASFKVKEKMGRKMAFTVAVVDEGLLSLTNFRQADPWNAFYKKEASSLSSYDMFNYISGAFGGKIESLIAIGGSDEEMGGEGSKKAERFKSVAILLGPYELAEKEEKNIEFDMPQYMGAVRLTLVATEGVSYGVQEKKVKVASPLVVLPTFPRVLGVGEEMEVPVAIFNSTASPLDVKVKLKGEGAININEEKSVTVASGKNENVRFKVKAERVGKTVFSIEGSGGTGLKAFSNIEIESISRGTPYIAVETELLQANAEKDMNVELPGEVSSKELFLEISSLPSLGVESRLSYLLEKPSNCLEQVVSKAFAQIYLPVFVDLDEEMSERRKVNITYSLEKLKNFQTANGGFSYWQNERGASLWESIYAGHFMCEAKKMGFDVEESMYNKFLEYSIDLAKNWNVGYRNDPELQAYRLYVLSLAGKAELQAMNKLKAVSDISELSKSLLAASYIIIGKKDVGKKIANDVSLSFVQNERGLKNYGSSIRDVAMKLQTYTLLEEQNGKVNECIHSLANVSSSDEFLSTNEIAWIFTALSPYYNYKKSEAIACDIFANGEKLECSLNKTSKIFRLKVGKELLQNVKIKNKSSASIYAHLTAKSMLANEDEKMESLGGLSLKVGYEMVNMIPLKDIHSIEKGERFFIIVNAKNSSNVKLDDLMLNLPIPTGWELTNKRMSAITEDGRSDISASSYAWQDFTDTNVYTYFSLKEGESKQFVFEGVAVYDGKYNIPSIVLESMYDPARRAVWKN